MNKDVKKIDKRYMVPGLERGLSVLQSFSADLQEMSVVEIAKKVGITRSSAFRLVYTLETLGFLDKISGTNKYKLSSRVLDMGFSYLSSLDIVDHARPVLEQVRDHTKGASHILIREKTEVVYVACCSARTHFTSTVGVGTRFPAHATAPGIVLLADLSVSELVSLYEGEDLQGYTEHTPTSLGDLISRVEEARGQASVSSWGYFDPDVAAVASPVRGHSGRIVAALSMSCPISTYSKDEFEEQPRQVVEAFARELTQMLGGPKD